MPAKEAAFRQAPIQLSLAARKKLYTQIARRFRKLSPQPRCELYYETAYQLLVSVVLSAQTTDKMVNRCMEPLYKDGFSPDTVLSLGAEGLLPYIRSIGLAPTKSKNVYRLTQELQAHHEGKVPGDREALEALPGVGRKTANVVLGEIFSQPTLAVDTHVFRVGLRLGLHTADTPHKAEKELLELVPASDLPMAHHWLILHGRYTCKAQKPACETCLFEDICPSRKFYKPKLGEKQPSQKITSKKKGLAKKAKPTAKSR